MDSANQHVQDAKLLHLSPSFTFILPDAKRFICQRYLWSDEEAPIAGPVLVVLHVEQGEPVICVIHPCQLVGARRAGLPRQYLRARPENCRNVLEKMLKYYIHYTYMYQSIFSSPVCVLWLWYQQMQQQLSLGEKSLKKFCLW